VLSWVNKSTDQGVADSQVTFQPEPFQPRIAERAAFIIIALLAIVLRLNVIHYSLWLDEAWVANSILSPSLSGMLYYDRWVQTTPPLLLILIRALTSGFGISELGLRTVPLVCGLISVLSMAAALRRMVSPSLALLGTTFFAGNYYAAKYSQEVKQYSADLLVSCLFLLLVWVFLESNLGSRAYWGLVALGSIGIFLSYITVFWYPAVLLVAVQRFLRCRKTLTPAHAWTIRAPQVRLLLLTILYAGAAVTVVSLFIYPNRAPNLVNQWQGAFWGRGGFLLSSSRFLQNLCQLWIPHQQQWWLIFLSYLVGTLCGLGLLHALIQSTRGQRRGQRILFLSTFPIAAALGASVMGQYPVLQYPRFILWMLPLCTVLVLYGLEPIWTRAARFFSFSFTHRISSILLPVLCVLYLLANVMYLKKNPPSPEQVREATLYLKTHAAPQDAVFVSGADIEQFSFYTQLLHWFPQNLYVANTWWPCCSRNKVLVASNPQAGSLKDDLHSFVLRSGQGTVWLLFPSGKDPAYWTYSLRSEIREVPKLMRDEGCRGIEQEEFRNAAVYTLSCASRKNWNREE
jgi:dolichyl-phosphate-mannose-protein mannosyltransferase